MFLLHLVSQSKFETFCRILCLCECGCCALLKLPAEVKRNTQFYIDSFLHIHFLFNSLTETIEHDRIKISPFNEQSKAKNSEAKVTIRTQRMEEWARRQKKKQFCFVQLKYSLHKKISHCSISIAPTNGNAVWLPFERRMFIQKLLNWIEFQFSCVFLFFVPFCDSSLSLPWTLPNANYWP